MKVSVVVVQIIWRAPRRSILLGAPNAHICYKIIIEMTEIKYTLIISYQYPIPCANIILSYQWMESCYHLLAGPALLQINWQIPIFLFPYLIMDLYIYSGSSDQILSFLLFFMHVSLSIFPKNSPSVAINFFILIFFINKFNFNQIFIKST